MKKFINLIFNENPIFSLLLGLCPALAVTTTLESSMVMGICVLTVLIFSNLVISLIKKVVPDNVRIPVFIIIIGTFVTIIELLLGKFLPELYKLLNIYLPLIVVNCIILGRALSVASKENVFVSLRDALGIGIGYTLSLMLIGMVRELFGAGTITLMDKLTPLTGYRAIYNILPFQLNILLTPSGTFLVLGILLAVINVFKKRGVADESN